MFSKIGSAVVFSSVAALLVGAAASLGSTGAGAAQPASACTGAIPRQIAAPAGHELAFELLADGVQIYACAEATGGAAWVFQAPDAMLMDRRGRFAGKHRAGPTWAALDGSRVVASKVEAATPDPAAIPWLLLQAVSHHRERGRMAEVTFIQRVQTSGGTAPSEACTVANAGVIARVPYRAAYCFYRSAGIRPDGGAPRL